MEGGEVKYVRQEFVRLLDAVRGLQLLRLRYPTGVSAEVPVSRLRLLQRAM